MLKIKLGVNFGASTRLSERIFNLHVNDWVVSRHFHVSKPLRAIDFIENIAIKKVAYRGQSLFHARAGAVPVLGMVSP